MHKPLLLLAASCCTLISFAQTADTLVICYKTNEYSISKQDKQKLDSFLLRNWDRLTIHGYTDETDGEEYNLALSKKRSGEVYRYFIAKSIPPGIINEQYFGEAMPIAENTTEDGRAQNRRTEVIGYRFPRVKAKPAVPALNPMLPVTRTLDNGFIITYRPGLLPENLSDDFESGSGAGFRLVTNTTEMRQNNLFNNTTNGEILSSVLIFCGERLNPCKLDSPILVKVPIPFKTKCPVTKVKFFNAVAEKGRRIWQEQTRLLQPETINGMQYVGVWMDDFCECINFDFKIDPDCFETDSTRVFYTNGTIRNLTTELKGLNSVYIPRKINDSTSSIVYLKNKLGDAPISFSLFKDKRRVKGYKDKLVTDFPYDETTGQYMLSAGRQQFYFPRLNVWDVVLHVNGDRYRVPEDKNVFDFTYLKYKKDSIYVDFTIYETKKRAVVFRNQPLASLPYNEVKGYYIIDKKFLKELKQKMLLAGR